MFNQRPNILGGAVSGTRVGIGVPKMQGTAMVNVEIAEQQKAEAFNTGYEEGFKAASDVYEQQQQGNHAAASGQNLNIVDDSTRRIATIFTAKTIMEVRLTGLVAEAEAMYAKLDELNVLLAEEEMYNGHTGATLVEEPADNLEQFATPSSVNSYMQQQAETLQQPPSAPWGPAFPAEPHVEPIHQTAQAPYVPPNQPIYQQTLATPQGAMPTSSIQGVRTAGRALANAAGLRPFGR